MRRTCYFDLNTGQCQFIIQQTYMNKSRSSPITLKKQSLPHRRKSQAPIDQQLQSIQQKLRNIRFTQQDQNRIKYLWTVLPSLRQIDNQLKYANQSIQQVGSYFNISSPQKSNKTPKSMTGTSFTNSNRSISNLNNEIQNIRQQIMNYNERSEEIQKLLNNEKMRQILQTKSDLTENINNFQKQLQNMINQTKIYTSNSHISYSQELQRKIIETPAFVELSRRKSGYQSIIGMLWCMKKQIADNQLRQRVKQRYEKVVILSGNKTKKNMKQILIDAEKRQKLQQINGQIGQCNDQIIQQANFLKNQIKNVGQQIKFSNQIAQAKFHQAFARLQNLKNRIEGSIQYYSQQFQKIQQTLLFSRPKLYSIQHKDSHLAQSFNRYNQIKQRWEDLQRMLTFQYCAH